MANQSLEINKEDAMKKFDGLSPNIEISEQPIKKDNPWLSIMVAGIIVLVLAVIGLTVVAATTINNGGLPQPADSTSPSSIPQPRYDEDGNIVGCQEDLNSAATPINFVMQDLGNGNVTYRPEFLDEQSSLISEKLPIVGDTQKVYCFNPKYWSDWVQQPVMGQEGKTVANALARAIRINQKLDDSWEQAILEAIQASVGQYYLVLPGKDGNKGGSVPPPTNQQSGGGNGFSPSGNNAPPQQGVKEPETEEQGGGILESTAVPPQTPWPTFTVTTDPIATAIDQGLVQLNPVELSDLINKTAKGLEIWNLPDIQSVQVQYYWDGAQNWTMGWAPSYKEAKWSFRLSNDTLVRQATLAGCSTFISEGALIYEAKVSNTLSFVSNDSAGIAKYMFPAGETSVFGCYVWPTSAPAPTSTPRPPGAPAEPPPTPINYISECNITIGWNSLLSNPGQVTGSGNSFLAKHTAQDPNNRVYVGNATEYAIRYCITGMPTTINGVAWDQQMISLTGQQYNGNGECSIGGAWVSSCWQ
jgi:hypothetical protein